MPDYKTYRTVDDGPDVVHAIRVSIPGENRAMVTLRRPPRWWAIANRCLGALARLWNGMVNDA